jgi:Ferritin-like domain
MPGQATRRDLLRRGMAGGLGAIAALGAGARVPAARAAATAPAAAVASGPPSDAAVLVRLLRFQRLVVFVYQHVLASAPLSPQERQVVQDLQAQEQAHALALTVALHRLGGAPPAGPATLDAANRDLARRQAPERLGQLRGARDALQLLFAVERMAEGVYYVAVTQLDDAQLLRLSAEIMASAAQHATVLHLLLHPGDPAAAVPYALVRGLH